jgi:glycosyltransferase involved in cell wall biosynthesis
MQAAARQRSGTEAPTVFWLSEYGGTYGGIGLIRAVQHFCRDRGWGFEVDYTSLVRDRPWLVKLDDAEIPYDFAPDGRRARARWLAAKLDRLAGPAILHTHFAGFDLAALAVGRRRSGVATVWHVHSFLRRDPAYFARAAVKFGWLSRFGVARIVCASEAAAASVRRRGGPRRLTTVVENGIAVERYRPTTPEQRTRARASLGLGGDDPVLLHFGWDWQVKGGALFTEALARLRVDGVAARGLVVGGGDEFRSAADRLGIGDALVIAEPSDDVLPFLDAADLLLATSPAEGGGPPLAVLEALSCGRGVVATDIPGHRVVGGGPRALRLAPSDPDRIAAAARAVLAAPPDERRAEAVEARDWVVAERNLPAFGRRMGAVYAAVASEL